MPGGILLLKYNPDAVKRMTLFPVIIAESFEQNGLPVVNKMFHITLQEKLVALILYR